MPSIPYHIDPYVPRFMKEPFFQPPTSSLPLCSPPKPERPSSPKYPTPPESLYFPLLPPPPHLPRVSCTYRTPPGLFMPPSSLSYTPPAQVLLSSRPPAAPSALPATFYTPFSRYYAQPRFYYRTRPRRPSFALPSAQYEGLGRSVRFFSK